MTALEKQIAHEDSIFDSLYESFMNAPDPMDELDDEDGYYYEDNYNPEDEFHKEEDYALYDGGDHSME